MHHHTLARTAGRRAFTTITTFTAFTTSAAIATLAACWLAAAAPRAHASGPISAGATPAARADAGKAALSWQSVRAKHGGSGVLMRYAVPDKIAVGETVTLRLQFSGISAPDGATVEVRDLAIGTTLLKLQLSPGETRTAELSYTGRSDGMQFVDVTTTQGGRSTVQSVPLRVGSGELKLKPEGQRRSTPSGEAVISLPAASPAPAASR